MRLRLILIASLFLTACGRGGDGPAAPSAPAFDLLNNPDGSNAKVYRYEDEFAVAWTDPGNGLRATHWSSRFQEEPGCGNFEGGGPIAFQDVGIIDAGDFFASFLHTNAAGAVWIIVRDLNQPGDCFGAKLVAEGWGRVRYTDNDDFGIGPGSNTNAWGYMADGVLTMPGGGSVRYSGHLRIAVTGAGALATARGEIFLQY